MKPQIDAVNAVFRNFFNFFPFWCSVNSCFKVGYFAKMSVDFLFVTLDNRLSTSNKVPSPYEEICLDDVEA